MDNGAVKYDKAAIERGYTGRILQVDLSAKEIRVAPAGHEIEQFVGGRGYCLKLVFDGTNEKTRYDSPENVLAIAGGPFCGETAWIGTGKFIVGTISPLTGTFCDSNVGGHFFALAKLAGFDAIAVTGKSDRRVMLVIDGDASTVTIEDAPEMEGSLSGAEELIGLRRGEGKPSNVAFVCTGPAADHSWIACINSIYYDNRRKRCRSKQAGRGGTGAVMRDKNLWGILVKCNADRANANRPADRDLLRRSAEELRDVIRAVDPNALRLFAQGTTSLVDMMNNFELLPVNNYQYGSNPRAKNVSGFIFEKKVFTQNVPDGCYPGCNLACTKGTENYTLRTGPHKGKTVAVDGPEYETLAAITNLGIFDVADTLEYAWYCDEYAFDTISAGVTMSFLAEAFERGFLTAEDTGGIELKWDAPETVIGLLHQMAAGATEFSRAAGCGVRYMKRWIADRAHGRLGRPRDSVFNELSLFGMECKGLEFSMYITKESLAQQGGYGFALKGPQHDEAWLIGIDQLNQELPTFEQKAEALKWFPLFRTWFNIAGLCKLPWIDVRHPEAKNTPFPAKNMPTVEYYINLVNATLGTEKTLDDILLDSERCYTLHKLINLRQGFGTREHDAIPLRAMAPVYLNEYLSRREFYEAQLRNLIGADIEGKTDEERLAILQARRREIYEKLTDAVYGEKGYDRDGIPTDDTLRRVGLDRPEHLEIARLARARAASPAPRAVDDAQPTCATAEH
jgi:aldehyde:ferredoxin oxidoreductase